MIFVIMPLRSLQSMIERMSAEKVPPAFWLLYYITASIVLP